MAVGEQALDEKMEVAKSSNDQVMHEAEAMAFLQYAAPERVERLLRAAFRNRPDLNLALRKVLPLAHVIAPPPPLGTSSNPTDQQQAAKTATTKSYVNQDTVEFAIDRFYCREHEGTVDLAVLRLGERKGNCAVSWHTVNGSALAGKRYEAAEGRVEFADGEVHKTVTVKLLPDNGWQGTLDFKVVLHDADNCSIGEKFTRVKVIDDGLFPTDKYKDKLEEAVTMDASDEKTLDSLPRFFFMAEYWKVNLKHPIVYWGSVSIFLTKLLSTILKQVRNLLVNKFLIDNVLNETSRDVQTTWLIIVCVGYFVPALVERWLAYRMTTWKVGGTSRLILQENLLKKFLAYDEEARVGVTESDCIIAVLYHVPKLVTGGFNSMFELISILQTLVAIVIVQIAFISGPVILPIASLFVGALFLAVFFYVRVGLTSRVELSAGRALNRYLKDVQELLHNQSLLKEMHKVLGTVDLNVAKIKEYNGVQAQADGVMVNNLSAAILLTYFTVASYIGIAGYLYTQTNTTLTVGDIRSTIINLSAFAISLQRFFDAFLTLTSASVNLNVLSCLLNRKVEDRAEMEDGRFRVSRELANLKQATNQVSELRGAHAEDCQQLMMDRVEFEYLPGQANRLGKKLPLLHFAVPQGSLNFMIGPHGSGKGTVLSLLAGRLRPRLGTVFVPPHLKMLHVNRRHMFIETMSLWQNVTLGMSDEEANSDECPNKIVALCKRLELSDDIIASVLRREPKRGAWERTFSDTELRKLHLCRAFLANPAVLVMESPALHLNEQQTESVVRALRDFVDHRGLEQDPTEFQHRHPRTVVATMLEKDNLSHADQILMMTTTGLQVCDPQELFRPESMNKALTG